ncbi:MAG TPA: hypothetical protein VIL33_05745 [Rhodothermia bacterium]
MKFAIAVLTALLPLAGAFAQEGEMSGHDHDTKANMERPDPKVPQGENQQRPEGWEVRLDKPDSSAKIGAEEDAAIFFVNMTPGWHITAHKQAIFYHPANTAEGSFKAKSSIYLFDPGERDREAFGMFVGGQNLDSETQEYVYFLLRNTGEFLIKRRNGAETSVVVDWTKTDAMKVHPHDETDSVLNVLEVHAGADDVSFHVNGTQVASLRRSDVDVDGVVGLRVNHGLNLHVSDLAVSTGE